VIRNQRASSTGSAALPGHSVNWRAIISAKTTKPVQRPIGSWWRRSVAASSAIAGFIAGPGLPRNCRRGWVPTCIMAPGL
jgi:hypothetical protein